MSNTTDRKFNKTKFEGVFWRLSAKRDPRTGLQDRVYSFWFADHNGKGHWKTVGRHSQGVRPQTARLARSKFLAELADTGCNPIERNKITIGQAVEAHITSVQSEGRNIKPSYSQYNTHLRDRIHATPIANVTPGLLSSFKAELLEAKAGTKRPLKHPHRAMPSKKLAPATINNIFDLVRSAVNRAIATGMWQGNNPLSTKGGIWKPVKVNNRRLRFLSPEEAKNLLAELQILEPQVHDMALLSLRTGIRATEIFKLKGQDIDANANLLHIIGKGGKRVPVKVPADIIAILAGYGCAHSEPIFKSLFTGKALTKTPYAFPIAVRRLKLAPTDGNSLYAVTFHTLRHTFASWLAQSGKVSLLELKALMRHKGIDMTMRYAHLIPGQESEKLSIIDDILA